jgi:hypothetical protein
VVFGLLVSASCGAGNVGAGPGADAAAAGASAGATASGGLAGGSGGAAGQTATGGQGGASGGSTGAAGATSTAGAGGGAAGASPDAGAASDAGATSTGPGCAGKSYKLCEDFESGAPGAIPTGWTALRGYAAMRGGVGLATDAAHSGKMSLKSDSMQTGMDRVQRSLMGLGATITKHWGRVFYKAGQSGTTPKTGVIHITMLALEGTTENRVVDTVVATSGSHQWLFNIPDDSCCAGSPYNWKFDDAWHCAEWNIDVATSSFKFFSDGVEVPQLTFTGKAGARMSTYTAIGLGTIYYQVPPSNIAMWFDDLAVDDARVGCN